MKIGVIGAGISGLTAARLLGGEDVEVIERDDAIGGIAKVKMINGVPYHTVGGHCLNSKNPQVLEFINRILPKENWHAITRIAKISFKGKLIDYPIEFSVPQIAKFDPDLAFRITTDFLASKESRATNLEDWFRSNFGNALADEYFIPYNSKIWGMQPSEMSTSWVDGKLPIPNKRQFFNSLIGVEKDSMPHSEFFYPNDNSQNQFIEALSVGIKITKNYEVKSIEFVNSKWIVNGEKIFDEIISTMPLNLIPFVIVGAPEKVKKAANLLRYNKISNMLWETEKTDATWTYYPDASTMFHRHIHIGNFLHPKSNYTITEMMGDRSSEILEEEGRKIGYLIKPIDYHVSDHAYVVFDHNYASSVSLIKDYLSSIGIHTLGRFGEWEYYNMDICIEKAMQLVKKIRPID